MHRRGIVETILRGMRRVRYGLNTRREAILWCMDKLGNAVTLGLNSAFKRNKHYKSAFIGRLVKEFSCEDYYQIKDIRMPLLEKGSEGLLFGNFEDVLYSYARCDDRYDEETFDFIDSFANEGPYSLVNEKVKVVVEKGDIVIDAGSSVGDFAAYASVKGALAYAFEPSSRRIKILQRTSELNAGIIPVQKVLGAEESHNSEVKGMDTSSSELFDVTTLDNFVRENNLPRIDFIKCDIEGNERHMLAGAQETLARFAPKLALCTYHLPDDPQVMAELILKANPKYNIVQKRKKLFASVPE